LHPTIERSRLGIDRKLRGQIGKAGISQPRIAQILATRAAGIDPFDQVLIDHRLLGGVHCSGGS
jgi:hypothetical protein